jgi:hypothetical protein
MGDKCGTRARGVLAMGLIVLVPLLAGLGSRLIASTTLFLPPTAYDSGGRFAVSVAVGDLDRDGHPDLVTANEFSSNVGVLLNEGDGTFRSGLGYAAGGLFSQGVATADVDNDGKPDVLVAVRCRNNGDWSGLAGVLLGNGDGTLRPAVLYPSGGVAGGPLPRPTWTATATLTCWSRTRAPIRLECSWAMAMHLPARRDLRIWWRKPAIRRSSGCKPRRQP